MPTFRHMRTWSVPGGLFHWINAVCILFLLQIGFIMMFREDLGFDSTESKIALKYIHSYIGFVFVTNLGIRAIRGVLQKPKTFRAHSATGTGRYILSIFKLARPKAPVVRAASRWVTLAIFALMTLSTATGLLRTSTDLYLPPLGPVIARWIADSPDVVHQLDPRSSQFINEQRLNMLNQVKVPIGLIHKWSAWALLVLIVVHVRMASDLSNAARHKAADVKNHEHE